MLLLSALDLDFFCCSSLKQFLQGQKPSDFLGHLQAAVFRVSLVIWCPPRLGKSGLHLWVDEPFCSQRPLARPLPVPPDSNGEMAREASSPRAQDGLLHGAVTVGRFMRQGVSSNARTLHRYCPHGTPASARTCLVSLSA